MTYHSPPAGVFAPGEPFVSEGFAGPFPLGSQGMMNFVASTLTRSVFNTPGPMPDDPFTNRHLDSPLVAQLCTHPAIAARAEQLLGPDLVVWRSLFFFKGPHGKEVDWHQDGHFWNLVPPVALTAWIAIDRAHAADHCMQVIPGSHKQALEHVRSAHGSQFPLAARVAPSELARAIELPLEAGTFVLFDQHLAHRSGAGGPTRRLALSVRIAPAFVRIDPALLPGDGRVLPLRAQGGPVSADCSRAPDAPGTAPK